jgi:CheY-like chemotaxis protein
MKLEVIIVDDDEVIVMIQKMLVINSGFHKSPLSYPDGRQALDHIRENKNEDKAHFIFLDINMPVMNGWEFLDAITLYPFLKDIFICVVTSSISGADRQKACGYPEVIGYLEKPINMRDLIELKGTDEVSLLFTNYETTG